jgi:hypothetical protein
MNGRTIARRLPYLCFALIAAFLVLRAWRFAEERGDRSSAFRSKIPTKPDVLPLKPDWHLASAPSKEAKGSEAINAAARQIFRQIDDKIRAGENWLLDDGVNVGPPRTRRLRALLAKLTSQYGSDTPAILLQALRNASSERYQAIFAGLFSLIGAPDTVPQLRELAGDKKLPPAVRRWAYYGVAKADPEAWSTLSSTFEEAGKTGDRALRESMLPAISQMGSKAVPLLLQSNLSLRYLRGDDVRDQLQKIAVENGDPETRLSAIEALSRPWNAKGMPWVMEQISKTRSAGEKDNLLNRFGGSFIWEMQVGAEEEAVPSTIDANLTASIRDILARQPDADTLALLCRLPQIRESFPDWVQRLAPGGIKNQSQLSPWVLDALARSSDTHTDLAVYLTKLKGTDFDKAFRTVGFAVTVGQPSLSGTLEALASQVALNPEASDRIRRSAWTMMAHASDQDVEQHLRNFETVYSSTDSVETKSSLVRYVHDLGPKGTNMLVNLLKTEPDETVRWDIMSQVFDTPGILANATALEQVRPYADRLIGTVLSGDDIVATAPGGLDLSALYVRRDKTFGGALTDYSMLLEKLLSAYGTEADVDKIRAIPSKLYFPRYALPDDDHAKFIQSYLWRFIEPATDSIRAHSVK